MAVLGFEISFSVSDISRSVTCDSVSYRAVEMCDKCSPSCCSTKRPEVQHPSKDEARYDLQVVWF